MERLTIEELIEHCDRQMNRLPSGNKFYQEHESVRAYLQILRHYIATGLTPDEIERILDAYGRGMTLRTENAERLRLVKDISTDRLIELSQAEKDGRLVVLPPRAKSPRHPHDEKIDALKSAVGKYCSKFMQMQTYGGCRAACPFHAIGNQGQAMCSDRFIEENPEKVAKILGIDWEAEVALKLKEV